jgi:hypothetical protein
LHDLLFEGSGHANVEVRLPHHRIEYIFVKQIRRCSLEAAKKVQRLARRRQAKVWDLWYGVGDLSPFIRHWRRERNKKKNVSWKGYFFVGGVLIKNQSWRSNSPRSSWSNPILQLQSFDFPTQRNRGACGLEELVQPSSLCSKFPFLRRRTTPSIPEMKKGKE